MDDGDDDDAHIITPTTPRPSNHPPTTATTTTIPLTHHPVSKPPHNKNKQFGHIVLTTTYGIMDHEEARRRFTGGKVLGFFY